MIQRKKYRRPAMCRICTTVQVGWADSDDERMATMKTVVDGFHVCNPCGETLNAQVVAATAAQKAATEATLAAAKTKLAKLGLTAAEADAVLGAK
jgi:hypothetical protein